MWGKKSAIFGEGVAIKDSEAEKPLYYIIVL